MNITADAAGQLLTICFPLLPYLKGSNYLEGCSRHIGKNISSVPMFLQEDDLILPMSTAPW